MLNNKSTNSKLKFLTIFINIIFFAIFLLFNNLQAQNKIENQENHKKNQQDTMKSKLLEKIVITADRNNEIIPSQRLAGEELKRLNSHTVADAIRYFSGIQIKDYGGIGGLKTVDIRSMGSNHLGVFYDGIQLGNAQNGQVDLGKFSLDNLEEISIYNGQKSEIFQSAKDFGAAATIYLKTRRPKFEQNKNYNLKTTFRGGSFDLLNPSVLWEQKLTQNISSSINAEYVNSSGKYKFRYKRYLPNGDLAWDTTATRQNGDINAMRIEATVNGSFTVDFMNEKVDFINEENNDFNEKNDEFSEKKEEKLNKNQENHKITAIWNTKFYFYNSNKGIPGAIVNNVWKHSQRQWDKNLFVQANLTSEIHPKYHILINAKYANDFMRYLNPDTTLMYIDNEFVQQEAYFSVANYFPILQNQANFVRKLDFNFSADLQWNKLNTNSNVTVTNPYLIVPKRLTTMFAFASAIDFWKIKAQASILTNFINENETNNINSNENSENNKLIGSPALFLSYQVFENHSFSKKNVENNLNSGNSNFNLEKNQENLHNLSFRAFYKRIFRMPTFNDLYYTDIGNANLKPEFASQYNIGFLYSSRFASNFLREFTAKVDAYYNKITNKIIAVPKGSGQFRWMIMNLGNVEIKGIDANFGMNFNIFDNFSINTNLNYTFQIAEDISYKNSQNNSQINSAQIPYIPWHNGSFTVRADFFPSENRENIWQFNYSFIYIGERYTSSANIRENHEQPWYTTDISLAKNFQFNEIGLKISLEINNLLNQYYDVILNYPMPGRNFRFGISANI